jgi:hypothetical protein
MSAPAFADLLPEDMNHDFEDDGWKGDFHRDSLSDLDNNKQGGHMALELRAVWIIDGDQRHHCSIEDYDSGRGAVVGEPDFFTVYRRSEQHEYEVVQDHVSRTEAEGHLAQETQS